MRAHSNRIVQMNNLDAVARAVINIEKLNESVDTRHMYPNRN